MNLEELNAGPVEESSTMEISSGKNRETAREARFDLIKKMFEKYQQSKTLEKVALEFGYTRERIRQYFMIGNRAGIIHYHPFNRENFHRIKNTLTKKHLTDLFREFGTVRSIAAKEKVTISHINRLVKIYDLDIQSLRKDYLKKRILQEYRELIAKYGERNLSTYDLLNVKDGRNLWARIARTWGTFKKFREENEIRLLSKPRRQKKKISEAEARNN